MLSFQGCLKHFKIIDTHRNLLIWKLRLTQPPSGFIQRSLEEEDELLKGLPLGAREELGAEVCPNNAR